MPASAGERIGALEPWSLREAYDAYPRIEEEFEAALDESLAPRGPEMLLDLVSDLGYEVGAKPREAAWLWQTMGVVPASTDPRLVERAFEAGGLAVDERIVIGTEWGESAEERSGRVSRKLIHASRLRRDPHRYIERFGRPAYEIMLADCHWAVYAAIGKLSRHVWLLSPARGSGDDGQGVA